jgi:hypothetical protein
MATKYNQWFGQRNHEAKRRIKEITGRPATKAEVKMLRKGIWPLAQNPGTFNATGDLPINDRIRLLKEGGRKSYITTLSKPA